MEDYEEIEAEEIPQSNGELKIYQQDKAILNSQIETAKRYPRNTKRAISNAITLVTLDKDTAEKMTYALKKGGKNITGPSVYLARVLAQVWGNVRIESKVIGFDDSHVTCSATCFDLETNYAIRTEVKRSIVGKTGRYSEDMCTIVANAASSIAMRNSIFAVIPQDVTNKVYNEALKAITGDLSDKTKLETKRTQLFQGFKDMYQYKGLSEYEICKAVGKSAVHHITKEDIATLLGFEKSISIGEMTFEGVFRPVDVYTPPPAPPEDKSEERILLLIADAKDKKALEKLKKDAKSEVARVAYDAKFAELNNIVEPEKAKQ